MKLDFRLRGLKSSAALQGLVTAQVTRLCDSISIGAARVVLERQRGANPAWNARAHLEVPGPDLQAEARDHTVEAAWRKVMAKLSAQIGHRLDRRRQRVGDRRRLRPAVRTA